MNTQLDSFETALLAELRQQVTEHPAPAPASVRRPRRRPRLRLVAAGVTGLAASVVAVFGLGSSGGSPAYAVEETGSGDVIVIVHRLDDAAGLERALRAKGIDADVTYDAEGFGTVSGVGSDGGPLSEDELASPPPSSSLVGPTKVEDDSAPGQDEADASSLAQSGPNGIPVPPGDPADDPCGLGTEPTTLDQQGSDWVLTIPAESPLQDRHVEIGTDAHGGLLVAYVGDDESSLCGLVSMDAPSRSR